MVNIIKSNDSHIDMLMSIRLEMLRIVNGLSDNSAFSKELIDSSIEYFKNPNQTTLLAISDGKAIGCATICYINIMPTFDHPTGKRAHLMNVYTNKDYRRQGIALKMMDWLIDEAMQEGVTEISLDATKSGEPLYERCGFTKTEEGMVLNLRKETL